MTELSSIFIQLFQSEPVIVEIPGWSHMNPDGIIPAHGSEPEDKMYLALSQRADSTFQFYNDAYQSHQSGMVSNEDIGPNWLQPMDAIARKLISKGYPIRGFNLYLLACGQKKNGKTYELLMKVAMLKALKEVYSLQIGRETMIDLICETNGGSVLDALYLSQIASTVQAKSKQALMP